MATGRPQPRGAGGRSGTRPSTGAGKAVTDFQHILESLPDGIAVQARGRLVFANAALARLLGYPMAELQHLGWPDVVPEADLPVFVADAEAALAEPRGGSLSPVRRRLLDKSGVSLHVDISVVHVEWDGAQAVAFVVGRGEDPEVMDRGLREADRMAAVGALAAGVAHEINNPLAYVVANLAFAIEHLAELAPANLEEGRQAIGEALVEARDGIERVRQVAGDLRTFSRGEERVELVDLCDVLESTIKMAGATIRHRATIVREMTPAPRVKGCASRLGQVFLNLLVNAFHAVSDKEGEALITVRTGRKADNRAIVEIEDTGPGIPHHVLRRVFEPFFTTKPSGIGTGLGLSVCRNIIEEHSGSIDIESRPGEGTLVRVVLPPAPVDFVPHVSSASLRAVRPRRLSVLVIDDDPMVLNGMKRLLRQHSVAVAAGGRAGLEVLAERTDFDVILCDLMMPEVSGMDVYETLLRSGSGLERRIVFVSGGAVTEGARELLERVPNVRVEKPLDPRKLDEILAMALEASAFPAVRC